MHSVNYITACVKYGCNCSQCKVKGAISKNKWLHKFVTFVLCHVVVFCIKIPCSDVVVYQHIGRPAAPFFSMK